MSLKAKVTLYLVVVHLMIGLLTAILLEKNRWLLIPMELFVLCSALLGYRLAQAYASPLSLVQSGTDLLSEGDFATRFQPQGHPELDRLIDVYNGMADRLRGERLRVREQHQFLDHLIRASPAGIVILDLDGRLESLNPRAEELLGTTTTEARGLPPERLASPLGVRLAALLPAEHVIGSHGPRRLRCERAEFYDRGFPRSFFVLEELTEEIRASEREAYDKLIRIVSHEVNNSLGAVRSLLQSLAAYRSALDDSDQADFEGALGVAVARLDNLGAFMASLAEVVRIPPPTLTPVPLRELVDDIRRLMREELHQKDLEIRWAQVEDVPPAPLDRHQMEQVLINVLKNAAEAMEHAETRVIALALNRQDDRIVLTVRDHGMGIDDAIRDQLFRPFFTSKGTGLGLGLTLVQEILRGHGFGYDLEPHPEGGATFTIRIPTPREGPG